jgi:hypothetical protein
VSDNIDPPQGVTELRVHGVGGTRPESILEDPHLRRVSGDDLIGFYRPAGDDNPRHHREAVSWGKITAGDAGRALWGLLLPFALANLAGWTHPPIRGETDWNGRTKERIIKSLVRVFALSMTIGATLLTANLFIDMVAYQCGSVELCRQSKWWLSIFQWSYLEDHLGARLGAGALLCLLALLLLLWVSRSSYKNFEEYETAEQREKRAKPGEDPAAQHPADVGLGHEDFWRGAGPVGQLRNLHSAAAVALITCVLTWAIAAVGTVGPLRTLALFVLALGCLALLAAAVAVVSDQAIYRRPLEAKRKRYGWLKWGSFGLLLVALIVAFAMETGNPASEPRLRQLDIFNHSFFIVQGVLLGALFGYQWRHRPKKGQKTSEYAFHGMAAFAICSLALFVLASGSAGGMIRVADLLGDPRLDGERGIASGCPSERVTEPTEMEATDPTGTEAESQEPETILCYAQYHQKTSIVALVVLAALVLVAGRVWLWMRRQGSDLRKEVIEDLTDSGWTPREPLTEDAERRLKQVSKSYSLSTLVLNADSLLLRVVLIGSAVALVQHFGFLVPKIGVAVEFFSQPDLWRLAALAVLIAAIWLPLGEQPTARRKGPESAPHRNYYLFCLLALAEAVLSLTFVNSSALANGASWAVTLLPVGLAAGLYGGLRNPNLRRSIGVVWDVITFWPRHFHPFAPPCYGERLVPQLKYRLEYLTELDHQRGCGRVLLSAHSQGSVVAAATLLQVDPQACERIALFTYGSPLEILYKRLFPAYFGGGVISAIEQRLLQGNIRVPWRHFYCRTDPIGVVMSELKSDASAGDTTLEGIETIERTTPAPATNTPLLDPHTWEALHGEPPWPMRRHSAYLSHPSFLKNVDATVGELAATIEGCLGAVSAETVSSQRQTQHR